VQFFFLIAVHEGVGNECAHEQLIADRFHLRYRDTSLPASVATRTLPRIESWVSTWLESFFRPTSELLLDVVDEDGGIACSARNGTDGRDGLVAGWPKTSWRENKSDGDVELGRIRCLVSAVLGKGLPFYGRSGLQRSSKPARYLVWTTRSLTMVSSWGLGGLSAISKEDGRVV
jgi:hypothetical protein